MHRQLLLKEINSISVKHSDLKHQHAEEIVNAAGYAWDCLELLAKRFCFTKCLGCCGNDGSVLESWDEIQDKFHEALSYLHDIHDRVKECPACAVTKALKTFPLIAYYSPKKPNGMGFSLVQKKDGTFDYIGKENILLRIILAVSKDSRNNRETKENGQSDFIRQPLPCCDYILSVEVDNEVSEERVIRRRETTLLNINVRALPRMHPDDKAWVCECFEVGQQVIRSINHLIHPQNWCEKDGILIASCQDEAPYHNSPKTPQNGQMSLKPDPKEHTTAKVWTLINGTLRMSTKTSDEKDGTVEFAPFNSGESTKQMKLMQLLCHKYPKGVSLEEVIQQVYSEDCPWASCDAEKLTKTLAKVRALVSDIRNRKLEKAGLNPNIITSLTIDVTKDTNISLRLVHLRNMDDKSQNLNDKP